LLCPGSLQAWFRLNGYNRAKDLWAGWIGLSKAVEVKQTARLNGSLIVRPPFGTTIMLAPHVDDCFYVLMIGPHSGFYEFKGWADRDRILKYKTLWKAQRPGQCDCWMLRQEHLNEPNSILQQIGVNA
jgi:hypothetical protein